MSELRDRIAAALRNMTGPESSGHPITYEGMADAVIAIMQHEYAVAAQNYIYNYVDERSELDDYLLVEDEQIVHRYVTEWETDEVQ